MGSVGKASNILGSSGKSYKPVSSSSGYNAKSSSPSFIPYSGKNDNLGSSGKSGKPAPSSPKSTDLSGKSTLGSNGKTGSFFGYSSKSDNVVETSGKSKISNPTEKSSFLMSTEKNSSNILGSSGKSNKNANFSGKSTPDASRDYPSFINPQSNKSQTRIGFIWIPTRKRNKKKEMVYNSHNYDRYNDKGPSMYS